MPSMFITYKSANNFQNLNGYVIGILLRKPAINRFQIRLCLFKLHIGLTFTYNRN